MKKAQLTEEQIAFALKQAGLGTPVPEAGYLRCYLYEWRKKYGGVYIVILINYKSKAG
ncbi:hypothetical protein V2S86_20635 [Serratia sp. C2(1)]|nr:hypothetical protein [Serratia sp. C2(2)]MEE4449099.1 hypothetical protein [Serratia sp. C2(1)]